jgi:hypothetical protein
MPQADQQERIATSPKRTRVMRPALTEEADEQQMIFLATDLARKQLLDGTASSQVITHYLSLGSSKKKLESEVMELQKELLAAKTAALRSNIVVEELYTRAISAMRIYSGNEGSEEDDQTNQNL